MTTSKSAKFWDRVALSYSKQPISDEAAYQKKLEVTRTYLRPDMDVFEFGCGTGSTAIAHSPYVKHILATDISPKMIEIAQSKINPSKAEADNIPNVTFEQGTVETYSQSGRSWDAVLGLNILHLQNNWTDIISQVYQMLKPGGVFVSSTICIRETARFIGWVAPIGSFLGLMPSLAVFTTDELETALTSNGFKIDYQWQPKKGKALFIVARKPSPESKPE